MDKEKVIREISEEMSPVVLDMGILTKEEIYEESQIEESVKILDNYVKDITLRLRADFDNEKKRIEKVHKQQLDRIKFDTLSDFTEVIDDLQLFGDLVNDSNSEYIKTGYILVSKKVDRFLKENEIEVVNTDIPFDPDLHESVSTMDEGKDTGTILKVVSKGYMIGGKIIKYPKVIVQS